MRMEAQVWIDNLLSMEDFDEFFFNSELCPEFNTFTPEFNPSDDFTTAMNPLGWPSDACDVDDDDIFPYMPPVEHQIDDQTLMDSSAPNPDAPITFSQNPTPGTFFERTSTDMVPSKDIDWMVQKGLGADLRMW
jgi:hypothetical protein